MVFDAYYHEDVILAGGLHVRFRAVAPPDKRKLAEGFACLAADSRYRRFFLFKVALTPAELRFFTEPNGINQITIAAVEIDRNGEEGELITIALPAHL